MKEFLRYFLGAGTEIEFTNFSLAHFLPILCMIAVILLIRKSKTQLSAFKYERNLRLYLALVSKGQESCQNTGFCLIKKRILLHHGAGCA